MWNRFASQIDPNVLRQRIFEEAERINNTLREPVSIVKNNIKAGLDTIYPKQQQRTYTKGTTGNVKVTNPKVIADELAKKAPQTVAKATPKGAGALIAKSNIGGGIGGGLIGAGLSALTTAKNWNEPGSDWGTRALDVLEDIGVGSGALLGGLVNPWASIPGGIIGGVLSSGREKANKRRQENVLKQTPYEDAIRNGYYPDLVNYGSSEGDIEGARELIRQNIDNKAQEEQADKEIEEAKKFLEKIMLDGQDYNLSNPPQWDNRVNFTPAQLRELTNAGGSATGEDNSLVINPYGNNLRGLNGQSDVSLQIPSSLDVLAQMLGYQQGEQVPQDNRSFAKKVFDRADELREQEGLAPELRGYADVAQGEALTGGASNIDAMGDLVDRLQLLSEKAGNRELPKSYEWGPLRRSAWSKMMGMTPYQIWGDYPNDNTALKNQYELLAKEFAVRKDIEDRVRQQRAIENITQKFADPTIGALLTNADTAGSTVKDILAPRLNYDIEAEKERQKNLATLLNTALSGQNTLANTELQGKLGINKIDAQTLGKLLQDYQKLNTLSANIQYAQDQANYRAGQKNQLTADIANQNALLALEKMKNSGDKRWQYGAQMIASGMVDPETSQKLINAFMQEYGIGDGKPNASSSKSGYDKYFE